MNRADLDTCTVNSPSNREKIIPCKENRSEYRYVNSLENRVAKIKFDGCLINDETTIKCDYLLVDWDSHIAVFIELKGSDIYHALNQIGATIDHVWPFPPEFQNGYILARIVATRVRDSAPTIKNSKEHKAITRKIVQKNGSSPKPTGKELILTHTGTFSEIF